MSYVNSGNILPLPRFAGGEPQPAEQLPVPAEPFPGEPGDDPGPQPGDPGAEPPPAHLDRVPDPTTPLGQLAKHAVESSFAVGRHQSAMIEMLCGLSAMVNLTSAAVRAMRQEDISPMTSVTLSLINSLRELMVSLELKQNSIN